MKNRRYRRKFKNNNYKTLNIISKTLFLLIIVCLIVFINLLIRNKSIKVANNSSHDDSPNIDISEVLNNTSEQETLASDVIKNSSQQSTTPKKQETTINMAFTGDIMCHNTIYYDAFEKSSNSYDFSYIFDDVKYYIQTADIAVGNLETTFAGSKKAYSSYPTFNTPENLAYTLKKVGFDVVSTANNHCYDSGYSGIESTIDYLDDADISHTGTYKSQEDQNKILIKNVKGIQIAFLSFTYGTNGIRVPSDKSYSVNLIDKNLILQQLNLAKQQNPDMVCVSMHWGIEYQTSPNSEQKDLADFLFKNGVDIIIGNHPHVLQSMEKRKITLDNGEEKDVFVVYSLGNFLADQNKNYTRDSAILNLNITKNNEGKITINSATYTPTYIYKNTSKSSKRFSIINLKNSIDSYDAGYETGIGKTVYNTFKKELNNIYKFLGNEIK